MDTAMTTRTAARAVSVVPGVDTAGIAPVTFAAQADPDGLVGYRWSSRTAPGRVVEAGFEWFLHPRSMVEALGLAFGDEWRIDVLPAAMDDRRFFLLTHRALGVRLLSRVDANPTDWCSDPLRATGDLLAEGTPGWVEMSEARREWLRREVLASVDTPDLRSMIASLGVSPDQPLHAPGESDEQGWLLFGALIEVWLAEHGYTDAAAVAVRTMVALSGLAALDAYGHPPSTAKA